MKHLYKSQKSSRISTLHKLIIISLIFISSIALDHKIIKNTRYWQQRFFKN